MNQFRRSKVCSQTFLLAKTKRWFRQWVIGAMSLWGGAMLLVAPHSRADELVLPGAGNEVWRTSHGALEVRENILHNAQSIGSDPAETFLAVRNEENYTALLNQTSYSFEYHLPWGLVRLIEHELEGKSLIQEQVEGRVALPAVPSSTSYTYFSAVQESISRSLDQDPMITRMHQRARALCRLARPTIDPSMTYSHPLLTEPYFDPQSDLLWITDQKEPLAVTSLMRNPGQILYSQAFDLVAVSEESTFLGNHARNPNASLAIVRAPRALLGEKESLRITVPSAAFKRLWCVRSLTEEEHLAVQAHLGETQEQSTSVDPGTATERVEVFEILSSDQQEATPE